MKVKVIEIKQYQLINNNINKILLIIYIKFILLKLDHT